MINNEGCWLLSSTVNLLLYQYRSRKSSLAQVKDQDTGSMAPLAVAIRGWLVSTWLVIWSRCTRWVPEAVERSRWWFFDWSGFVKMIVCFPKGWQPLKLFRATALPTHDWQCIDHHEPSHWQPCCVAEVSDFPWMVWYQRVPKRNCLSHQLGGTHGYWSTYSPKPSFG